MTQKGILYLLPVTLGESELDRVIPLFNKTIINELICFIAEDAKNARRFLKQCQYPDISKAEILLLNEHTKHQNKHELIQPLLEGKNMGLMSDAGCPGIADPGADIVRLAHSQQIKVVPLVGPSSIVLTIMASGFNGQNFAFNGYLPIDKGPRLKRIKELESLALKNRQAQFFIETPYRNNQLFDDLLKTLQPNTLVCVAKNISLHDEVIISKSVKDWSSHENQELHKQPTVFGIYVN